MAEYPDIPRYCTAAAEVFFCALIIHMLGFSKKRVRFVLVTALFFVWQTFYLMITDDVPLEYWLICMLGALCFCFFYMFYFIKTSVTASVYYTLRAFVLAEFTASLYWQIICYLNMADGAYFPQRMAGILITYIGSGVVFFLLERRIFENAEALEMSLQEVFAAAVITILVFALSNLSFVTTDIPFTSPAVVDIFNIRTLVDLSGTMVLFAFQNRIIEMKRESELASINSMLKTQYDRYRGYQEGIDLINMKYHDLKHQIDGMRADMTSKERSEWLDNMEKELSAYKPSLQTGNQVLDALLDSKSAILQKQAVQFTCVVDGELLNFMYVMDLCTIFGNALDNAIESASLIDDPEKRVIHLTVTEKKKFVLISVENYAEQIPKLKNGLPVTSKKDTKNHGFGVKSIMYAVKKYDGTVSFEVKDHWVSLNILIPV